MMLSVMVLCCQSWYDAVIYDDGLILHYRLYQMDKGSLIDHISKIRIALCDKGLFISIHPCIYHPSIYYLSLYLSIYLSIIHSSSNLSIISIYLFIYLSIFASHASTDPCVMAATLPLFHSLILDDPLSYKDLVPSFVSILKQIIDHRLPREYDYHRIPSPWIQVNI